MTSFAPRFLAWWIFTSTGDCAYLPSTPNARIISACSMAARGLAWCSHFNRNGKLPDSLLVPCDLESIRFHDQPGEFLGDIQIFIGEVDEMSQGKSLGRTLTEFFRRQLDRLHPRKFPGCDCRPFSTGWVNRVGWLTSSVMPKRPNTHKVFYACFRWDAPAGCQSPLAVKSAGGSGSRCCTGGRSWLFLARLSHPICAFFRSGRRSGRLRRRRRKNCSRPRDGFCCDGVPTTRALPRLV